MIARFLSIVQATGAGVMRTTLIFWVALAWVPGSVAGQGASARSALGVEAQAYLAGFNAAARFSYGLGPRDAVFVYAGYNATDRRDWGEHFNEEGGGPGGGLAWRHYVRDGRSDLHFGLRADLWFLEIDWSDWPPADSRSVRGATDVVVFQPTAQGGYTLLLGDSGFQVEGTVALGAEVNIRTKGEAVGQGAILLAGVGFAYRF
jgi:hypothetical protein